MDRILITYGTRPFAQRVARLLDSSDRMVYGSCEPTPQLMLDSGKYTEIPHGSSPSFSHEMLKCCLDRGVGLLIPLGTAELRSLAEAKQLFAEYDIHILVPDSERLEEVQTMENPPARMPLDIILDGVSLLGKEGVHEELSGVFVVDIETGQPVLCCTPD